jgi:hypothetical protein
MARTINGQNRSLPGDYIEELEIHVAGVGRGPVKQHGGTPACRFAPCPLDQVQMPARHAHEDATWRMAPLNATAEQGYTGKHGWSAHVARQT